MTVNQCRFSAEHLRYLISQFRSLKTARRLIFENKCAQNPAGTWRQIKSITVPTRNIRVKATFFTINNWWSPDFKTKKPVFAEKIYIEPQITSSAFSFGKKAKYHSWDKINTPVDWVKITVWQRCKISPFKPFAFLFSFVVLKQKNFWLK